MRKVTLGGRKRYAEVDQFTTFGEHAEAAKSRC